ncbi:ketoacyl-ACP synthase III [Clostridium aminobutyricum]|uniref:Ketoacyl-ACP synthase III n=1 Tax=Clostridium aminobutyricum TaxID=33953 RepID=A0A939DA73_CLOAM|nr:ketoacyl-ACP synthase III [Clostridium aminobutyricum]MBN7774062.1 ketoacyl-ACP synthase III [Clostridium aminobutyricum]
MPILKTVNVELTGICCALPQNAKSIYEIGDGYFSKDEIEKATHSVGVKELFVAEKDQTAADFCYAAAEKLIETLKWEKDTIDGLLFVSQTPDYKMPATSCVLHGRLGLKSDCIALDINLGCSGFVHGLFLASQFIQSGACKRILVMTGDTLRRHISPQDKGISFIISDGGAATAVEYSKHPTPMTFIMKTDGNGYEDLIIEAGGERLHCSEETKQLYEDKDGSKRSKENFYMNGMNVFTFAIKQVPNVLNQILEEHPWNRADVDLFLLHQANSYMVKYIAKRAKIDENKIPINIGKFGNTNGSTIPFLICDLKDKWQNRKNVVLAGFGIGLSWGAVACELEKLECAEIIRI